LRLPAINVEGIADPCFRKDRDDDDANDCGAFGAITDYAFGSIRPTGYIATEHAEKLVAMRDDD
jgi:hypothetical protein